MGTNDNPLTSAPKLDEKDPPQAQAELPKQPPVPPQPPAVPPAVATARTKENAIDLCNRYMFTAAVGIVLLEILGCLLRHQIIQAGAEIKPEFRDIPLLFGILITLCGNFNFYKRILEPVGESPGAALFSLFGMVAMASLPVVLLIQALLPFRYVILGAYGLLVILKNYQLKRRFANSILGNRFSTWERRAVLQTLAALIAGGLFYVLTGPPPAQQFFARLLHCPALSIPSGHEPGTSLVFNVIFVSVCAATFVVNQKVLFGIDAASEAETSNSGAR